MKRVPAYQRDAYKVATFTLSLGLLFGLIKHQMQVQAEFVSPAADAIVLEKEVPVEIPVPRLPENVEEYVRAVFGKEANNALKVFRCESGLKASAKGTNKNGSTDVGIAQINSVHGIREKWLKNYKINILVAHQLWEEQGWGPWVCSRKMGVK
jgi:hypothetical protein